MEAVDLWMLLFDQATQFRIIHAGMLDLRVGDTVEERDWLGNPITEPVGTATRRRKPVTNTLPDILIRADALADDGPAAPGVLFAPLVDAAEQMIAGAPEATRHCSTWLILFLLLASDNLKTMVRRGTVPHIAEAYLEGFDERISTYVCGKISYAPRTRDARAKSGKILETAVSPTEAVCREWHYLEGILRRARPP
jgi:hypothetical protein